MTAKDNGHSSGHSSDWNCDGFADRLKSVIGDESVNAFALKSGVSESLIRKYLAGSTPGIDKAVKLAEVGQVSLDWLIAGKGPETRTPVDLFVLLEVLEIVEMALDATGKRMIPQKKAELIVALYDFCQDAETPPSKEKLLKIVKSAA